MPSNVRPTRGWGLLEGYLAKKRAKMANSVIESHHRKGIVLDIGCGSYPIFLMSTEFALRIGMDNLLKSNNIEETFLASVYTVAFDIEADACVPLADSSCDVVTMLAVIEHIDPSHAPVLLKDVYRILKPGGLFILTTPSAWTDLLLRILARMRIVSAAEIEDHKVAYTRQRLHSILQKVFPEKGIQSGHFELFMNLWASAKK